MEEVCTVGGECKCLDARKTFPSEVGGDVVIRGNLTVFGAVGAVQVHLVNTDAYGRSIVSIVDRGAWQKDVLIVVCWKHRTCGTMVVGGGV